MLHGAVWLFLYPWYEIREIGERPVPLTFFVVDAWANTPIPGASIRLFYDNDGPSPVLRGGLSEGRTAG